MDYLEARAFLKEKEALGSVYGLSVMRELLSRLGNPEKELSFVHVAGTNGKGSTIAFASEIMKQAGYRVGCYTSPAVFVYEEIIRVDGAYIPEEAVARLISKIRQASEEMVKEGFFHPTVFEMETAMAFCYFKEQNCQLVFAECGLGGELDATNVIEKPLCAAFASISREHMGILGNSLSEIAMAKSGIMKPGTSVVSAQQEAEVRRVLEEQAGKKNCSICFCTSSSEKMENLKLGLFGLYQQENAKLALGITEELKKSGFAVTKEAVEQGLLLAEWPGRLQRIGNAPEFYLDGAHNEGAAEKLAESVKFYFTNRRICYIMGVFRDKEYERLLEIMAPLASSIVTVTAPGKRGLDGRILAESAKKWCQDVHYAPDYEEAVFLAEKKAGKDGVVLAFGSLSYLGEIERMFAKRK